MSKPLLSSYSCTPRLQTVRTDFDTGLPRVRRRSQAKIYDIHAEYICDAAETKSFIAGIWGAMHGGAGWGVLDLQIDGVTKECSVRLTEPYVVRPMGGGRNRIIFKLEYIA